MAVATPEQYAEMLDTAKKNGFAFPAINVSSSSTINAVLQGLTEAGSDGIIQVTTGGADYFAGQTVKARASGEKTPASEYSLALQAREKGLSNDEERAFNRCLKYDPKYALCHFGLFELFRRRSDEKKATIGCKNFLKYANETEFASQVATCKQYVNE